MQSESLTEGTRVKGAGEGSVRPVLVAPVPPVPTQSSWSRWHLSWTLKGKSPPARWDTDQVSGKKQRQRRGHPVCVCVRRGAEDKGIQERWLVARTSAEDGGAPSSFLSQEGGHGPSDECSDPGCRPHKAWPHPGTLKPSWLLSHTELGLTLALSDPSGSCPMHGPSLTQTLGSPQTTRLPLVQMGTLWQRQRQNTDPIAAPPTPYWHHLLSPGAFPFLPSPSAPPQLWNLKPKMKRRTQEGAGSQHSLCSV